MIRHFLNFLSLVVIALSSGYLISSASAVEVHIQAECGECSGVCCGYDDKGRCWASDNCNPVEPD